MTTSNMSAPKNKRANLSPRKRRLLEALLYGPTYREHADRVAGASNSPEIIRQLKNQHGLNIKTERPVHVDRDGFLTRPGLYVLQADSIEAAQALLSTEEAPAEDED